MENGKESTRRIISMWWRHWKFALNKNKYMLIGSMFAYSLSMGIELMYRPTQWKVAFDSLVQHESPWPAFIRVIVSTIIGWTVNRIAGYLIVLGEARVIKDLYDYCVERILGKSTAFFTIESVGGLIAKIKRFADESETMIDAVVFTIVRSLFFVGYMVVFSQMLIPELTSVFLIWIVLFISVATYFGSIQTKADVKNSETDTETTGAITDALASVFVLRVFSAIPKVFANLKTQTLQKQVDQQRSWMVSWGQRGTQAILVTCLEIYCMYIVIKGVQSGQYTIGTAVLIQSYIATLSIYMGELGRVLVQVRTTYTGAYEMAQILEKPSPEPISFIQTKTKPSDLDIVFSEVSFGYIDGILTLENFSFNFQAGRRYGLIGKTGSGKSTLTKLILRKYHHDKGTIQVNGQDISTINELELRSWISYVPQDPHFPSWTVREIVRMGKEHATDEEIKRAAQKASCDFIWEKLPNGLDTLIGEKGSKLSGGERQRLALAAAILKDGPIIVLDEPTSALDAQTEHVIQSAIEQYFIGKLVIVIAHRLSTVAILDEIILLNDGKVDDCGSHYELLESSPTYRDMWNLQTQGHKPKVFEGTMM